MSLDEQFLIDYLRNEKNLSDRKIHDFTVAYSDLSMREKSDFIYEFVGNKIYKEKPANIETFMKDPYFLGAVYEKIFPIWDNMLKEIYPAPFVKAYNEVILSCALRSGKTTCEAISMMYEMYLLMCMIDPGKTLLGKSSGSIVFTMLSKDNNLAVSQICDQIFKGISLSPYFQEQVKDALATSTVDKKGTFIGSNILLKAGSGYSTVIGTDLICGVLDEANIKPTGMAAATFVEERLALYNLMVERRERTYDKAPRMTGILWLTSSPEDEIDVLGERIRQVKEAKLQNVMIKDNIPVWEARCIESKEYFPLFLGSDFKDPCILDESDVVLTPEEYENVIQVPEQFRVNFRGGNIQKAIRGIAGRRTSGEQSFFKSANVLEKVFSNPNKLFTKDVLTIDLNNMHTLEDYLVDKDYFKHPDRPKCYRYIHLDIASKQDRFGMASVYSDMVTYTSEDGDTKRMRKYYEDFCLGIVPAKGGTVDILRVLEFVYGLKAKGYPIKLVTTDSHQGELARQIIGKHGIHTEYQSVEENKDPYNNLKNLILTESLEGHKNATLVSELRQLKEGVKKIGKVTGSTDDLSDSLAGACWGCFNDRYFKINDEDVEDLIFKLNNRPTYGIGLDGGWDQTDLFRLY